MILFDELWNENTSLQSAIASLRYILEALIHTKLLCAEDDYFEKVYFGVSKHQIRKYELLLEQARNDIQLLSSFKNEEEKVNYKNVTSEEDAKMVMQKQDAMYEKLDEYFSVFLDAAEYFGPDAQLDFIENNVIPSIEEKITELNEGIQSRNKALASDLGFNRKFHIKGQASKIPKILSDKRSWKEKAQQAGLESEYAFVYDYTSAILHCTSFSILTNPDVEKPEFLTFRSLSNTFMRGILENLFKFCGVPYDMAIIRMES